MTPSPRTDPSEFFPDEHMPQPETHYDVYNTSNLHKAEVHLAEGDAFFANYTTVHHVFMESGLAFVSENHGVAMSHGGEPVDVSDEFMPMFVDRAVEDDPWLFNIKRAVIQELGMLGLVNGETEDSDEIDVRDARYALERVFEREEFSEAAAVADAHRQRIFGDAG